MLYVRNSCSIFCFRNSIFFASPWTSRTFRGSAWRISCIIPLASAWALKDMYSTCIFTSSCKRRRWEAQALRISNHFGLSQLVYPTRTDTDHIYFKEGSRSAALGNDVGEKPAYQQPEYHTEKFSINYKAKLQSSKAKHLLHICQKKSILKYTWDQFQNPLLHESVSLPSI